MSVLVNTVCATDSQVRSGGACLVTGHVLARKCMEFQTGQKLITSVVVVTMANDMLARSSEMILIPSPLGALQIIHSLNPCQLHEI